MYLTWGILFQGTYGCAYSCSRSEDRSPPEGDGDGEEGGDMVVPDTGRGRIRRVPSLGDLSDDQNSNGKSLMWTCHYD